MNPASKYSDFMAYVDESGDHSLQSVDKNYPMFVLAFCIFYKKHYAESVARSVQKLKFDYFGHDMVILHEHEIRKEKAPFNIFKSKEEKNDFLDKLTDIIQNSRFILAACAIDKRKFQDKNAQVYHFALTHCLETLYELVCKKQQQDRITFVAVESRGKKEDADLELEFLRICNGQNRFKTALPFEIKIVPKLTNSAGLQVADLVARPIGRYLLDPEQPNRAFDVLREKFYCEGGRQTVGKGFDQKGLKHFP